MLGGSSQNWTSFRGHFYVFLGLFFLKTKCTEWGYFWRLQNVKYFLGVLDIPDILGVNSRCWIQAYV